MRIVLRTKEPFAFAGLWKTWKRPNGQVITSCAIITTEANRMPVIRPGEAEAVWLDWVVKDPEVLSDVLRLYDPILMDIYEVSALVNRVANNTPEVVAPVD